MPSDRAATLAMRQLSPTNGSNNYRRARETSVDLATEHDSSQPEIVTSQSGGSMLPARQLIEVLNDFDNDVLREVSLRSKNLKRFLKLPLLYLMLNAGL